MIEVGAQEGGVVAMGRRIEEVAGGLGARFEDEDGGLGGRVGEVVRE
jgi:hypothetical protein